MGKHNPHHDERGQFATADNAAGPVGQPGAQAEDMLVIDAATVYPRYARGGSLYSLDVIDGATIKPLIGEDGRAPEPPDPAYQQILKGGSGRRFLGRGAPSTCRATFARTGFMA